MHMCTRIHTVHITAAMPCSGGGDTCAVCYVLSIVASAHAETPFPSDALRPDVETARGPGAASRAPSFFPAASSAAAPHAVAGIEPAPCARCAGACAAAGGAQWPGACAPTADVGVSGGELSHAAATTLPRSRSSRVGGGVRGRAEASASAAAAACLRDATVACRAAAAAHQVEATTSSLRLAALAGACQSCATCPALCCFGTQPPDAYLAAMELERRRRDAVRTRSSLRRSRVQRGGAEHSASS
jgi:hypothetical protein